jgi:hypothetical protein
LPPLNMPEHSASQTSNVSSAGSGATSSWISSPAAVDMSWVVTAFTGLVVALLITPVAGEPDIWGHLRFGLDVLASRSVPLWDPYTFTQDQPMVYHEWLSGVVMALAYHAGGFSGLVVLKNAVMATTFVIL